MKKQIVVRALLSMPWALALGMAIIVIVSLIEDTGELIVAAPQLLDRWGEVNAFVMQCAATMLYGAVWAAASVVWDTDWPLLKQTLVHLLCCAGSALPIAWAMWWMPHSWSGLGQYLLMFACIYVCIWTMQYLQMRARVKALNERLRQQEQ